MFYTALLCRGYNSTTDKGSNESYYLYYSDQYWFLSPHRFESGSDIFFTGADGYVGSHWVGHPGGVHIHELCYL